MPCRVGITTDADVRRSFWENQVIGLTNWRILGKYMNREKAQQHETQYALTSGCHAHAGGADATGPWHVYRFDYTRTRV